MYVIKKDEMRVPAKIWANESDIDSGVLNQIINISNLPFAFKHVSIMPDTHLGYGAPIGGVMASEGAIVVNFVGVDIGCGMSVVQLPLKVEEISPNLKEIMGGIRDRVPVGFKSNNEPAPHFFMPDRENYPEKLWIIDDQMDKAFYQVGSLGGGNHFIEIQYDEDDNVYLMIHSGSRNLGYTVAKYFNGLAIELNEKWHSAVPKNWQLAFLPIGAKETGMYIEAMKYCTEFAKDNRSLMMWKINDLLRDIYREKDFETLSHTYINIAHNYATIENHFGKNVWVHRKGATSAKKGELGIIPGSQGTQSYIVRGLGNKDSFMSCSHGAGRKMSRTQAKKELNLAEEQAKLEGILHSVRNVGDLDEATGAYKDINVVMKNQEDLVEIVKELKPLAVVKG